VWIELWESNTGLPYAELTDKLRRTPILSPLQTKDTNFETGQGNVSLDREPLLIKSQQVVFPTKFYEVFTKRMEQVIMLFLRSSNIVSDELNLHFSLKLPKNLSKGLDPDPARP
jgi:hypothetical protein